MPRGAGEENGERSAASRSAHPKSAFPLVINRRCVFPHKEEDLKRGYDTREFNRGDPACIKKIDGSTEMGTYFSPVKGTGDHAGHIVAHMINRSQSLSGSRFGSLGITVPDRVPWARVGSYGPRNMPKTVRKVFEEKDLPEVLENKVRAYIGNKGGGRKQTRRSSRRASRKQTRRRR
jgi:hypothetical protein